MDVKYVMRKVLVDKKSLKDFIVNEEERRMIRPTEVANLLRQFNKDDPHFDAPFVVNLIGNKWHIIDGNHRYEAIRQKIEENKDFFITIWIAEYKGLNREEERLLFNKWNIGATQTATDFLKVHFSTIPLGETMLNTLPVSLYPSKNKATLKVFVGAYINAKRNNGFSIYCANGMSLVEDLQSIDMADIKTMRAFYLDYREVFGEPISSNPWYKIVSLSVLFRIWYDNRNIKREKMLKYMKKAFINEQHLWASYYLTGSRHSASIFYKTAIEHLTQISGLVWQKNK